MAIFRLNVKWKFLKDYGKLHYERSIYVKLDEVAHIKQKVNIIAKCGIITGGD